MICLILVCATEASRWRQLEHIVTSDIIFSVHQMPRPPTAQYWPQQLDSLACDTDSIRINCHFLLVVDVYVWYGELPYVYGWKEAMRVFNISLSSVLTRAVVLPPMLEMVGCMSYAA